MASATLRRVVQAFDPQLYIAAVPGANAKRLPSYDYFRYARQNPQLDQRLVAREVVRLALDYQEQLKPLTVLTAPSVGIDELASPLGLAAQLLCEEAIDYWANRNDDRPLHLTIACRTAALNSETRMNAIVQWAAGLSCDGYYLLYELDPGLDPALLGPLLERALMLTEFLARTGRTVWVGYAGMTGYLHRIAGASAFAAGWWDKTRWWSIEAAQGGASPFPRVALEPAITLLKVAEIMGIHSASAAAYGRFVQGAGRIARSYRATPPRVATRAVPSREDAARQLFAVCDALDRRVVGAFAADGARAIAEITTAKALYGLVQPGVTLERRSGPSHLQAWEDALRGLGRRIGSPL